MVRSQFRGSSIKERALGTIPQSALRATLWGGSWSQVLIEMGFRLYKYLSGHPSSMGIFWGGIIALLGLVISNSRY